MSLKCCVQFKYPSFCRSSFIFLLKRVTKLGEQEEWGQEEWRKKAGKNLHGSYDCNQIGDQWQVGEVVNLGQMSKPGGSDVATIGFWCSVSHEINAKFTFWSLGRHITSPRRNSKAFREELEMMNQRFHAVLKLKDRTNSERSSTFISALVGGTNLWSSILISPFGILLRHWRIIRRLWRISWK